MLIPFDLERPNFSR